MSQEIKLVRNSSKNEFILDIEDKIQSIFPESFVDAYCSDFMGSQSIIVNFAVGKDKNQWVNGIFENDIIPTRFTISQIGDESLPKNCNVNKYMELEMKRLIGGGITVNPTDKYHAYSSVKVPYRKSVGTQEKLISHTEKYFTKLKTALQENRSNIPEQHLKLVSKNF